MLIQEETGGIYNYIPKRVPPRKKFKAAECDVHDFKTRLKAIRDHAKMFEKI